MTTDEVDPLAPTEDSEGAGLPRGMEAVSESGDDQVPLVHWCLKVSGDTCPMPCAAGCDA